MSTSLTTLASNLPATDDLLEDFMSEVQQNRVYPNKFSILLGNQQLSDESTPTNPVPHPEFMKLILIGHMLDDSMPDGFENYRKQVDLKETEFLVLKWRSWAQGEYNPNTKSFTTVSEETDQYGPYVIRDKATGEVVYNGDFNVDAFKQLNIHVLTVLWVVPVVKGVIGSQIYRWTVKGQDYASFKEATAQIKGAQSEGRFLTLKVKEVTSWKNNAGNVFAKMIFDAGEELKKEEALPIWAAFRKEWENIKNDPNFVYPKKKSEIVDNDEVEVIPPTEKKPDYLMSPSEKKN